MSNRAVRVAWPGLTILVAVAALVVVLVVQGDDGLDALRSGRPVVRLGLTLAAATALGLLIAATREPDRRRRSRLLDLAAVAAAAQALLAGATGFLVYLGAAPAASAPSFGPGLTTFALELPVGRSWLSATVAAAVLSAAVVAVRSRRGAAVLLALALVALVPVTLQATASGDSIAAARTAVTAAGLRLAGVAVVVGALAVSAATAPGDRRATWFALAGAAAGLTGSVSTALLRQREGSGVLLAVDAAVLLVAAAGAGYAVLARDPVAAVARRVQLLAAAAAAGIGCAPAITDPGLRSVAARTTPAQILTGEALPAPLGLGALLGTWRADPLMLLLCVALVVGGAMVVRRSPVAPARVLSWSAGVVVLLWVTCGGLAVSAPLLLAAALAQHLALLLVVPLLLVVGATRASPSPAVPVLTDPRLVGPVAALLLIVLIGTGALRWSLVDPLGAEAVDLLLLAIGALLVHGALRRASSTVGMLAGLLAVEVAGGVALLLSPGLLQADWFGAMGWGTDALAAQRWAGVVGLLVAVPPTAVLLVVAIPRRPRAGRAATAPPLVRASEVDA
ncbi:cytochrome c oxidase assembly protein [uncultured Amnibacterium sp.]|uniref:cytochrome c oxidase assembly protein n=1 Tax=uncultured Amnibacterium sp. TaxID=1631851 RepID=UPI0035CA0503